MTALSNNIKLIRGLSGHSQEEFGRIVLPGERDSPTDVKTIKRIRSKISSYENGVAEPPVAVLANIAKMAGVPIDQLSSKKLTLDEIKIETEKTDKTNDVDQPVSHVSEPLMEYLKEELNSTKKELKELLQENALLKRDLEVLKSKNPEFPSKRGKVG